MELSYLLWCNLEGGAYKTFLSNHPNSQLTSKCLCEFLGLNLLLCSVIILLFEFERCDNTRVSCCDLYSNTELTSRKYFTVLDYLRNLKSAVLGDFLTICIL